MVNFFIPFMKEIEKHCMDGETESDIKELIESIIAEQENINFKNMKYIDARKKNKNWRYKKYYEKRYDGFRLLQIGNMNDEEITEWCSKHKLPEYNCINEIKDINEIPDEYKQYYCVNNRTESYDKEHENINAKHYNKAQPKKRNTRL